MTTKTPKFVQIRANRKVDGHVEPAQHRGEVDFFSIYLGQPGYYQWVADFECHTAMLNAAHHLVKAFGCAFDCSQYDVVMATLAPKTITVNGFEVPVPLGKAPSEGDVVWLAVPSNPDFASRVCYASAWDFHKFERGLLHTTKEAAVAHAKALLGIDPKESA